MARVWYLVANDMVEYLTHKMGQGWKAATNIKLDCLSLSFGQGPRLQGPLVFLFARLIVNRKPGRINIHMVVLKQV